MRVQIPPVAPGYKDKFNIPKFFILHVLTITLVLMSKSKQALIDMFKKSGIIGLLLMISAILVFIAGVVALIDIFIKNY